MSFVFWKVGEYAGTWIYRTTDKTKHTGDLVTVSSYTAKKAKKPSERVIKLVRVIDTMKRYRKSTLIFWTFEKVAGFVERCECAAQNITTEPDAEGRCQVCGKYLRARSKTPQFYRSNRSSPKE